MKRNILILVLCGMGCISLLVVLWFILFRSESQEEKNNGYGEIISNATEQDITDYGYMDIESPTRSQILSAEINDTPLDEMAVFGLPYYLDEYLINEESPVFSVRYLLNSYKKIGNVEYIRITIDEIPGYYYNCGYSIDKEYWMFNKQHIDSLPEHLDEYRYLDESAKEYLDLAEQNNDVDNEISASDTTISIE